MKPTSLLLIVLFCLNASIHAESATNAEAPSATNTPTVESLMEKYQEKAPYFLDKVGWHDQESVRLTPDESAQLEKMRKILVKVILIPGSHDTVLALLQSYEDHDGYSRQVLFRALLDTENDSTFNGSDLPFLKSVFLASLACKTGNYPNRFAGWIRPLTFVHRIALLIYGCSTHTPTGPMDESKRDLLWRDPKKWIEVVVP